MYLSPSKHQPSYILQNSKMSEMESFIKDDNNAQTQDALPTMESRPTPQPHPASVLGCSIATAFWYLCLSIKTLQTKDTTRWIWLLLFLFSCLIFTINSAELVQLLTNMFPAPRRNEALTTTKKEAHLKLYLINGLALPLGLYVFALSTDYSVNFDKDAKGLLIGIGTLLCIPYVMVIALNSPSTQ